MPIRVVQTTLFIGLAFLVAACASPSPAVPTHTANPIPTATPQATGTLAPTVQPTVKPTATVAPSNTSEPTVSPTVAAIAPTASGTGVCPPINPEVTPSFESEIIEAAPRPSLEQPVLDFLNQGGSPKLLEDLFRKTNRKFFEGDVTGDNVPELGIFDMSLHMLGCIGGKYKVILEGDVMQPPPYTTHYEIKAVTDMNLDGIPETIISEPNLCMDFCSGVVVYTWTGAELAEYINVGGDYEIEIKDTDNNGTLELLLTGGMPSGFSNSSYPDDLPWRWETDMYMWDGFSFKLKRETFSTPEYRFQAVQDGDEATRWGDYEKALSFYQEAIFSNKLDWWSPDKLAYQQELWFDRWAGEPSPTPPAAPKPDPAEYNNLAAYARYRIMLLHVKQGHISDAKVVYNTLQEKFPAGVAGHAYADMAKAFWDSYEKDNDLGIACKKAIDYATAYPLEVLTYLGNTGNNRYHGHQSHVYKPADVCPFN